MIYTVPRNVFDAGRYIKWASERGLGPGNLECFGHCEMASSRKVSATYLGPKKLDFQFYLSRNFFSHKS
jgi:hypothetical protein